MTIIEAKMGQNENPNSNTARPQVSSLDLGKFLNSKNENLTMRSQSLETDIGTRIKL